MRTITRRPKKERKITRRKIAVERLSSQGKCKQCESLFCYSFEGDKKEQIESNPKMAKRFNKLLDSELCLKCLTGEINTIKAWELMQFHVLRGTSIKTESAK